MACEFSGIVRDAFIREGHYAVSCDLLPSESDKGDHFQGDIQQILGSGRQWDLMIAHPPCTHLSSSGARWFKEKGKELQDRSLEFVKDLMSINTVPMIAIENPVGVISSRIRKPDQIIHPWYFGHEETKATCLWLKGLPGLYATDIRIALPDRANVMHRVSPGKDRWKVRSRTYTGIADAMAKQWGSLYWQMRAGVGRAA